MDGIALHNIDVQKFIQALDSCKGNVYLETPEGDRINMKSKLAQFAGISMLIEGGTIAEAVIRCDNPDDESKLFRFNLYGEMPKKDD